MDEGDALARDIVLRLAVAEDADATGIASLRVASGTSSTAREKWWMPPFGLRSRNLATGESGRDGSISSILARPRST